MSGPDGESDAAAAADTSESAAGRAAAPLTVGFVVNPVAGMGGRVGLKGTDGLVDAALERGAEPRAGKRAVAALRALADAAERLDRPLELLTWGGPMGADAADAAGVEATVIGQPAAAADGSDAAGLELGETSPADTRAAVRAFAARGVGLVLFVGGDGTAVDVAAALEATPDGTDDGDAHRTASDDPAGDGGAASVPILGVPAGVKVFSEVFAVRPDVAGEIAATFERTEPAEVNDLDEAAYREGTVRSELRAVVRVPVAEGRQSGKQLAEGDREGLVEGVAADVRGAPDRTWVFGPGGTVGAIESALGVAGSPLGVDVYRDGALVVRDGGAAELLAAITAEDAGPATLVVSPIGGQGFLFGRGNLQLSPAVLRAFDAIEVVASRAKLDAIGVLRVDTGDEELDEELSGWRKVRVGRVERRLIEVR